MFYIFFSPINNSPLLFLQEGYNIGEIFLYYKLGIALIVIRLLLLVELAAFMATPRRRIVSVGISTFLSIWPGTSPGAASGSADEVSASLGEKRKRWWRGCHQRQLHKVFGTYHDLDIFLSLLNILIGTGFIYAEFIN